ncbi:MAG: transcription antitermination factor NusB [Holosporales bacterium]|jgi:N utilization substance protein B|nr:transcription antitermination factor NusB [Holosporales bacterium]
MLLSARRAARVLAVQAIYQLNMTEDRGPEDVLHEFLDYRKDFNDLPAKTIDWDFFSSLFLDASGKRAEIGDMIAGLLNERWSMGRLDSVLKAIAFVGIAEISHFTEVPVKTSLDEYVEVTKLFFDKSEVSFVNGLLNAAAHISRASELS